MVLTLGSDDFCMCVTVHSQRPYSNMPQNQRTTRMMTLSQHGRKGKSEKFYGKPGDSRCVKTCCMGCLCQLSLLYSLHPVWSSVHSKQRTSYSCSRTHSQKLSKPVTVAAVSLHTKRSIIITVIIKSLLISEQRCIMEILQGSW